MPQVVDQDSKQLSRTLIAELLMIVLALVSAFLLALSLFGPLQNTYLIVLLGIAFTLSVVAIVRLLMDPDSIRAHQTDSMLKLARETLENMPTGDEFAGEQVQKICSLLLPSTAAIAVSITDNSVIRGYAGYDEEHNGEGTPIRTQATRSVLRDGKMRILTTVDSIGFPDAKTKVNAAIIVPLRRGSTVWGTLKFYYRDAKRITETQVSIAEGYGELLSTQLAAASLEEQTKLATQMELKMLQSQINPHFLFNTINTIASLIRTDPDKARILLREFAVFYRSTLENSKDLIKFEQEIEQVKRYFSFEVARFGDERVRLLTNIQPQVGDIMVPSFLVQPLVENAVHHAMPAEGLLSITVEGFMRGDDAVIRVVDDGVGMDKRTCQNIMQPEATTGMGIAVKNVSDRIAGYYGPNATLKVNSTLGEGTQVMLLLKDAGKKREGAATD